MSEFYQTILKIIACLINRYTNVVKYNVLAYDSK